MSLKNNATNERHELPKRAKVTLASGVPVRCAYAKLIDVDSLKPNPKNPNKHPDGQLDLYAKAILHQGWRRPIVVSRQSGLVVAGHGAVQTAKRMGWKVVPVDYQDFASNQDEMAHMLADNKIPQLAELSEDEARAIELELAKEGFDLELTGMDLQEIEKLRRSSAAEGNQAGNLEVNIPESWTVLVTCRNEEEQAKMLKRLEKEGFECRALIS